MKIYYYPETIYNVNNALLDLFDDVIVKDYDKHGNVVREIKVPIVNGPVTKRYLTIKESESGVKYHISLPRIALTMNSMEYDAERQPIKNAERFWFNEEDGLNYLDRYTEDLEPTPYTFIYTLDVMVNSMKHMAQILENFLPFFNPSVTLKVEEFSFLDVGTRDLDVQITGPTFTYDEDIAEDNRRTIVSSMTVTVRGWMYRPVSDVGVIKNIISKYHVTNNINNLTSSYDVFSTSAVALSGGELDVNLIPNSFDTSAYNQEMSAYSFTSAYSVEE